MTDEEVLICANEARSILKMIWCSKHRWLGHVLRHENLLHDIIIGKMLGKATWGRKRMKLCFVIPFLTLSVHPIHLTLSGAT